MGETKKVVAIFEDRRKALNALDAAERMGFTNNDIGMLVAENSWSAEDDVTIEENTKAPEGVSVGATTGGVVGAVAAGLTSVGAVAATGGLGLLAAGPVVASLAGAGAGGATGGLIGGLIGLGLPEVEAREVDEEIGRGAVMINVVTPKEKTDDLEEEFKKLNAKKVSVH